MNLKKSKIHTMTYHVRRTDREIKDENELHAILLRGRYGTIGLCKDNEPYLVTLSYAYNQEKKCLYFHCAKEGCKMDFIQANPHACMTVIEDDGFDSDSCEHSYKSLIIRGKLYAVPDAEEIDQGIKLLIRQQEKKDPDRFLAKLRKGNKSFDTVQMLKMGIENITGKARG